MILTDPSTAEQVRVGKVLCIGRNYAQHAAEMNASVPKQPIIFLKPSTAIIRMPDSIRLPSMTSNVHHEVELVAMIGHSGRDIPLNRSLEYVTAYAIGLDMTARDLQSEAKRKGKPWSVAKGFDTFAPLGELVSAAEIGDPQQLKLTLNVNGVTRQHGDTQDMIFSVAHLISYCSQIFTLEHGDLLYTGTPEGVGPVVKGDQLEAICDPLPPLTVTVV
ncbi:MAG: fumarylacetoacetate hydrolase family protein [Rhodothermaceae bacterium]|nr:fumarylacetoacetate hydrolase family protein [Rhodothermaceae bacterium]MXW33456.1 fumarylacetoacetate hydrolase family protein [Rhodothermaceae bacterium]MXZ17634.1 fumarylacetoacetate hydrolase family protein [Rhodothermaceae bacterium]MYC04810.1 fumarylacetoacetate hydrolase family protein [Rhodothermaceae bacterium]MYE63942.1 fumarylacetoacetate hydrolase family protein [Rhodothermaceae bacterium]